MLTDVEVLWSSFEEGILNLLLGVASGTEMGRWSSYLLLYDPFGWLYIIKL